LLPSMNAIFDGDFCLPTKTTCHKSKQTMKFFKDNFEDNTIQT
jgi:hypothetical protein